MSALPKRAWLGAALCACLLTVGIAAWPDSGQTGAKRELGADSRELDPVAGRRASEATTFELERPESRTPALSDVDCDADAGESSALPPISLRGRVIFADGSAAGGARVWSTSARSLAHADGTFELAAASAEELCQATLPGYQPARKEERSAGGISLRLGPPTLAIAGSLRAEHGLESQGWRIAILDATLIEPVGPGAATYESAASRASARMQCSAAGKFAIDGLSQRPYTLAAWRAARERIELFASPVVSPGEGQIEILIPPDSTCRTAEVRCVDSKAVPLPCVRVALPGTAPTASTDLQGKIMFHGALPAQLTLVLTTVDGTVFVRVVDLPDGADIVLGG